MIKNLPDAIQEIVEDIQAESVSSRSFTATSTSLTCNYTTGNNIFIEGMYVEIPTQYDNIRWEIQTLVKNSAESFTLTLSGDFSAVIGLEQPLVLRPFIKFKYDSYKNVQKRLVEESKGTTEKKNKYPLLILQVPYKEERDRASGIIFETNANFALIVDCRKTWTTAQRHEYSFKQKLHPLYDLFIEKLKLSDLFRYDENICIPHGKEDIYHWSSDEAKTQNKLAAVVDAIEITNLNLILNKN